MLHAERKIEHDVGADPGVGALLHSKPPRPGGGPHQLPTYSEVKPDTGDEEELRWLGHSKGRRPDLLQVVIGLTRSVWKAANPRESAKSASS